MAEPIVTRFIATGANSGKTQVLGRDPQFSFVDGVCELEANLEDTAKLGRVLEVNWQVFPEGSKALKKVQDEQRKFLEASEQPNGESNLSGDTGPEGTGPEGSQSQLEDGEGSTGSDDGDQGEETDSGDGPAPQLNEKLARAILSLDPEADDHWTREGLPSVAAVCQFYGSEGLTRAEIKGTVPGYTRVKAREYHEELASQPTQG